MCLFCFIVLLFKRNIYSLLFINYVLCVGCVNYYYYSFYFPLYNKKNKFKNASRYISFVLTKHYLIL